MSTGIEFGFEFDKNLVYSVFWRVRDASLRMQLQLVFKEGGVVGTEGVWME